MQGGGAKGGWQGAVLDELLGDDRVDPVAFVGSSAGAINAWLASAKLQDRARDPFSPFWLALPDLAPGRLLRLLPRLATNGVQAAFGVATGRWSRAARYRYLLPFEEFERVISSLLPPGLRANRPTYIYACDVDDATVPPVLDSQRLASFMVDTNCDVATAMDGPGGEISAARAGSVSACLPGVEPLVVRGRALADGGIYSNLPANMCGSQGALGGNCVVFVLATPLAALRPAEVVVDYRTCVLLDILRQRQLAVHRAPGGAEVRPAIASCPIYIVQPPLPLRSALVRGFARKSVMSADIDAGRLVGRSFRERVGSVLNGNRAALQGDLLAAVSVPELPAVPPTFDGKWVGWVNRAWRGQGAGRREQEYPTYPIRDRA